MRATEPRLHVVKYAPFIKEIGRGAKGARSLSREQSAELFGAMLDGKVPELEFGAILIALRIKSESLDELLGFGDALGQRVARIEVPAGPRCVVLPTYNGARRQPNLMPLVALLLARRGVPVLIQGRHDFESRVSPFDLLARLGIDAAESVAAAQARLHRQGLACIGLPLLCAGLDRMLATRLALGVRSAGHTMAKLIDPAPGRSLRVVAVTHPEYLLRMDEFLRASRAHAMLMRGTEGEIYANPRRRPRLAGYHDGESEILQEADESAPAPLADLPAGITPEQNADTIQRMLEGRLAIPAPIVDQVALLESMARNTPRPPAAV